MAIFDDDPRRDRPQPPSALRVATGRADGFVAPPLRYQASPRRRFASRRFADSTRRARHKRYRRLKTLCITLAVSRQQQRWYYFDMIDWSSCTAVEQDPKRVSGAWVFRGTRVPVAALFENLEDGASASEFIQWFPGVTRAQVRAVLDHAARSALEPA